MNAWLSRLRHDLVKRAVWPARDLREAAREPRPADVLQLVAGLFELRDGEGRVVSARRLWEELRREAPPAVSRTCLDSFGIALEHAERLVAGLAAHLQSWPEAVDAVLQIESAFAALAGTLEEE
jgi:hypothetical protein